MLKTLKRLKNRGQAMALYALLIPMLIAFVGVGLDMGWYYLTVSRMQNASDAAVMAGAWEMLGDEKILSDYSDALLIDFVPNYILKDPDTDEPIISNRNKTDGDKIAKEYVKLNLSSENATWDGDTIVDAYDEDSNKLTFGSQLYGKAQDIDDYGYYTMWYRVELEEEVKHFFLPGWFPAMNAKVQSVAKITHYIQGPNLFEQTKLIAEKQTYAGWDFIKGEKGNNGDAADNRSVLSTGNKYRTGDKHRFEILRLNGKGGKYGNTDAIKKGNPYKSIGPVDQTGLDDLFIDWQCDMSSSDEVDLGINNRKSDAGKGWTHFFTEDGTVESLTGDDNLQRRIHGTINFEPDSDGDFPYHVRDAEYLRNNEDAYKDMKTKQEKIDKNIFKGMSREQIIQQIAREPSDPLFARIESEPIHDGGGYNKDANGKIVRNKGGNGSSIRQIIINLNVANTTKYSSGEYAGEYSDRPVFFYYTGPEKYDPSNTDDPQYKAADYYGENYKTLSHARDSLPVIINFNENFRGIFFFPNSPVVINGNQKNFEGYVIAKEFVMLKTYKDDEFSYNGIGDFVYDAKNNVYYDISTLTSAPSKIQDDPEFTKVTYRQNGQTVEKYISNSDLEKYALTEANVYNSVCYSKDESGTAESLAYASGNGKINYYYTLRQKLNQDWQYAGTGWLDRKTARQKNQLATFQSGWSYNNDGNDTNDSGKATGQGVWRVKELLPDGTEDSLWLDEKNDTIDGKNTTKNRFLLKVQGDIATHPPQYVYSTADELLSKLGGYSQISDSTDWKKNNATEYIQVSANGKTYYLPKSLNGITLYEGKDPAPSAANKILIKYYDNGTEKDGYANISDAKKYYKIYQDDIQGNDTTTDNPMFVDELGNVQYRHKRDGTGKEIATNEDGSVAYETLDATISPTNLTADPYPDPALYRRAADEAVKELTAKYKFDPNDEMTAEERKAYIIENYSEEYASEVQRLFKSKFPYLYEKDDFRDRDGITFFDTEKCFNLNSSVFDSFELVKMTEYSYLNEKDDKRSINNIFTNEDAVRTD